MQTKDIIIMGAGGQGRDAVWVLEEMNKANQTGNQWNILGYIEDDPLKAGMVVYDYNILGTLEDVATDYVGQKIWYFCAIGNNKARKNISLRLNALGWQAATLIHPSVIMARNTSVEEGTYIGAGVVIGPNVVIGKYVLINIRSSIGHDATIGDYSQVSPGAQINGYCNLCEGAFIGSNASIYPKESVGKWATVGANSHVILSVKPEITVSGVPARKMW